MLHDFSGVSGVNHKESKRYLLPLKQFKSGNVSIATLVEEKKSAVAYKVDFECRAKSKVIAFLEFSNYQCSDARKKSFYWFVNQCPHVFNFRRRQRWKLPSFELQRLNSFNIEIKHFIKLRLEFWTASIPMQRTKSTIFPLRLFSN